jgi:Ca2+-transporting ATPase
MSVWYQLEANEALAELGTETGGLSSSEAEQRLEQYGPNELIEKGAKSPLAILLDQLRDPLVLLLLAAAVVSAILGEYSDVVVIVAIVLLNAVIGFTQEYRAEQAIAALKRLSVPTVTVVRDGRLQEISARDLVPGDIVRLETGTLVPADGRLLESANLRVQEAALTGESEAVEKSVQRLAQDDLPIGDRLNMIYMGTAVTYGRGTAVVTDTGMRTELGNIAELLQGVVEEQTPLQKRLASLGKVLGGIGLLIIAIVVLEGLLSGNELRELFLVGISLAVAVVPEGLPAVVAITLALGSQRMLKRNALIRRLPAVETLGSVTVVCSDKTGTLTQNRMTVTLLDVLGQTQDIETLVDSRGHIVDAELKPEKEPYYRTLSLLLKAGALANDAVLQKNPEGGEQVIGDPTEGALLLAAAELGHTREALEARWPRVGEVPFTSERKRMTTIHRVAVDSDETEAPWGAADYVAFCKGAVDSLLEVCNAIWQGDEILSIDDAMAARITDANERQANKGQRVLGVAYRPLRELPEHPDEDIEQDMIFIGLVSMIDPPRPEVRDSVAVARGAGIRPVMITGDHPLTARYIAQDLGIGSNGQYLTGQDLGRMSVDDLEKVVEDVTVYARVSPEHKLNIVEALQDRGHVVAMTGDGVNDAPALKRAQIGVAMGITGTDVSKEAADMVLLDDNFATIVNAIEEGRKIYDNIRKFVTYILSSNTGEVFVMLVGPLLGMPLPLLAIQILWINLVTDGLPGLALAVEESEKGIMKRPPYKPSESIFSRGVGSRIVWVGLLLGMVSLGVGYYYWLQDPDGPWQTMVFTTLALAQMGNAMALRSNTESVFRIGLFSNRLMIGAVILTVLLQLALIYIPFLQTFFETEPLSVRDLLVATAFSLVVFVGVEIDKWIRRRSG